jgi:NTE family protein
MEKKVDNKYYIDGGFYDNTPINMLIEKGYNKIYVVELNPTININRKPKKDVELIRIHPKRSIGKVVNFDIDNIREIVKMGYFDTIRVIKKLDGYNYCFKNYPTIFYEWITRKIPNHEMQYIIGFFNVKNKKQAVIKALEYVMKNEKYDYYKVYSPSKIIKILKKNTKKNNNVYNFIRKLNLM